MKLQHYTKQTTNTPQQQRNNTTNKRNNTAKTKNQQNQCTELHKDIHILMKLLRQSVTKDGNKFHHCVALKRKNIEEKSS